MSGRAEMLRTLMSTIMQSVVSNGGVNSLVEHFKYSSLSTKVVSLKDIENIKNDSRFTFCEISYQRLIGYWAINNNLTGNII